MGDSISVAPQLQKLKGSYCALTARAGWSDTDRTAKRVQLRRILNAAVSAHSLQVYYYQGLHDVASVLLLVLGEGLAFQVLCHLVGNQLRDCTRWGPA